MRTYAQLKKLSLLEWQLLVVSTVLLPVTALGLHLVGLRRTLHLMEYFSPSASKASLTAQQNLQQGHIVARMVSVAANHGVYGASCLVKSLVTCWLLRCYGLEADLRIGVKKDDADLNAHSWVEINGNVLTENENAIESFHTML